MHTRRFVQPKNGATRENHPPIPDDRACETTKIVSRRGRKVARHLPATPRITIGPSYQPLVDYPPQPFRLPPQPASPKCRRLFRHYPVSTGVPIDPYVPLRGHPPDKSVFRLHLRLRAAGCLVATTHTGGSNGLYMRTSRRTSGYQAVRVGVLPSNRLSRCP